MGQNSHISIPLFKSAPHANIKIAGYSSFEVIYDQQMHSPLDV